MFRHTYLDVRLNSRKSIRTVERLEPDLAAVRHLNNFYEGDNISNETIQPPTEQLLSTETELSSKDWVALNRARAKIGKTASILLKAISNLPVNANMPTLRDLMYRSTPL